MGLAPRSGLKPPDDPDLARAVLALDRAQTDAIMADTREHSPTERERLPEGPLRLQRASKVFQWIGGHAASPFMGLRTASRSADRDSSER
jgi:hypothetical protein